MKRLAILPILILVMLLPMPTYALNLSSAYISDSIPIPQGMTWDGSNLWITNTADNTFVQFSTTTNSIVNITPAVADAEGLACDGTYLWTFSLNGQRLYKVNPTTGISPYVVPVGNLGRGGLTYYDGGVFGK